MKTQETVKHLGGWRFEVKSASDNYLTHLVDLAADPMEVCDCKHHYYAIGPAIRDGKLELSSRSGCKHLKQIAQSIFDKEILTKARKEYSNGQAS